MNIAAPTLTIADATGRFFPLRPSVQDTPRYRMTFPDWTSIPPFVPQRVFLGEVASGWVVAQPLLVTLEQDEDGYYIASDDVFAVYGDGSTASEALQDYIVSLIDYYQLLAARAKDDPPTQALFRRLQSYLRAVAQ